MEDLCSPATYRHFSAVGQDVFKRDAQGEVIVLGAEVAGFIDVKLVSVLLNGDLQVVVLGQLALHDVNAFTLKGEHKWGCVTLPSRHLLPH